ncbi:tetratricopeptide repeat protein [Jonesiaceae bacterium BS-20]|uniref:Tetratricopeptide repeat protein n=1 Tax=Jonesiaceae bacterium BS-20 TaxID=3120821 RepID=A0AAU7DWL7_9MICO
MSVPGPNAPDFNVRGAVDLSALNRPVAPPPGQEGGAPAAGGFVVDLTEESFAAVVERSAQVPVVMLLWVPTDAASSQLATSLGSLAELYEGKFLMARVDVEAWPRIAAAFQIQDYPTVVGVIGQQPVPLFQGNHEAAAIQQVIDQFLAAAEANGVTGVLARQDGEASQPEQAPQEPAEEPLPPLHQKAYDAIGANDLAAAIAAYEQALREDPRDHMASAGLAQTKLLQRTENADLAAVRKAAADAPSEVTAQMAVADLDVLGGQVEDAFGRLLELLPAAEDRDLIRKRLVEYFEILGPTDPRVGPARRSLASALY